MNMSNVARSRRREKAIIVYYMVRAVFWFTLLLIGFWFLQAYYGGHLNAIIRYIGDWFALLQYLAFALGLYFVPLIVAFARKNRNVLSVFLLNLFLGWTLIGWVVALCWAAMATQQQHQAS